MSKEDAPNFRYVRICHDCNHLRHDDSVEPNKSYYCGKYKDTILSNFMKDFCVCDGWEGE